MLGGVTVEYLPDIHTQHTRKEIKSRFTTFRHADIDAFLVATSGTHVAPDGLGTTFAVVGALILGLLLETSSEESLSTIFC